jgi:hypothetical protein
VRFRPVRRFFLETPDMPLLFRRRALATLVSVIVLSATSSGQEATPREPSALLPGEIRLEVPVIDLPTLAEILGPILWMAIDEPSVALPAVPNVPCPPASAGPVRMPVDPTPSCRRAVYYQVRRVVFEKETPPGPQGLSVRQAISAKRTIDLSTITSLTMRYYFYYPREEGFKAHLHDLESAELDVEVAESGRLLTTKRITGSAHGIGWYSNELKLTRDTRFPITLLVEEGKHATSPDHDDNGLFTPGVDVNVDPHDAWGIRDTLRTGRQLNSTFQAWMMTPRTGAKANGTRLGPHPTGAATSVDVGTGPGNRPDIDQTYDLVNALDVCDPHSNRLLPSQTPIDEIERLERYVNDKEFCAPEPKGPRTVLLPPELAAKAYVSAWEFFPIGYRMDRGRSGGTFSIGVGRMPSWLGLEGWIVVRLTSLGSPDDILHTRKVSYDLLYAPSASRWIDWYVAVGADIEAVERSGVRPRELVADSAVETGWKFRFKPGDRLPFLGVRLGIRANGWSRLRNPGFILEVGTGTF